MKPDWDKLMKAYQGHTSTLVADVDCTADGKPLCTQAGVRSFPSIKFGDPTELQDYKGGRDFASLKKFVDDLKPLCGPANIAACDEARRKQVEEFMALSDSARQALISEKEAAIAKLEADFKARVDAMTASFEERTKAKAANEATVKGEEFDLLKAVHAHEASETKTEL
mmetsp:Transcript_75700/g.148565  ORF Transcript_75700/g.148565 Transcript_75700/m.148565 type:complete len:169 (-) Transcript_75700:23-529(-)